MMEEKPRDEKKKEKMELNKIYHKMLTKSFNEIQ